MKTRTELTSFLIIGLLAAFALTLATCTTESTPTTGTITVSNGLGRGGSDDGIIVTFLEVVNDSRCAEGVVCVDPGKADVRIGYSIDGGEEQTTVVEMRAGQAAKVNAGDRFLIELLRLLPDPPPVGGVSQGQYQLELRITED